MARKKANPVPAITGPDLKREDDYRAEDDHRTLTRAEEIRMDGTRMAGVRKHHRKMTRQMSRVARQLGRRAAR